MAGEFQHVKGTDDICTDVAGGRVDRMADANLAREMDNNLGLKPTPRLGERLNILDRRAVECEPWFPQQQTRTPLLE